MHRFLVVSKIVVVVLSLESLANNDALFMMLSMSAKDTSKKNMINEDVRWNIKQSVAEEKTKNHQRNNQLSPKKSPKNH